MTPSPRDGNDGRDFSFGVVVLAAGRSGRMGQPKLLLPWQGRTVLSHLLAEWKKLGASQIVVVVARDAKAIHAELDRLGFPARDRVENPAPDRGMFSSIQCAARWRGWKRGLTHWDITLGDQPHVRETTLRALLDFAAAKSSRDRKRTRL